MAMTPADLVKWRERLGWSQVEAATQLGISARTYFYLESGTKRGGTTNAPRDLVPRHYELACAELTRRHAPPPSPALGRRARSL